jgi:hypothetical protein
MLESQLNMLNNSGMGYVLTLGDVTEDAITAVLLTPAFEQKLLAISRGTPNPAEYWEKSIIFIMVTVV